MFEIFFKMKLIFLYLDFCLCVFNGFMYGMEEFCCCFYWICVDSYSFGLCCVFGIYYVEGMGCMWGLVCNDVCFLNGGKIYICEY